MLDLKLRRLSERTPVKLTINLLPALHQELTEYAALYAENYGHEEPVSELIPAMLTGYLNEDRNFQRSRARQ